MEVRMDFSEAVVRLAREVRLDVPKLAGRQTVFRPNQHCEARREK
jgi:hypothetical protein